MDFMFHVTETRNEPYSVLVNPKDFYEWMAVCSETESVVVRPADEHDLTTTPRAALQWAIVPPRN
jgi:hypothetical protein